MRTSRTTLMPFIANLTTNVTETTTGKRTQSLSLLFLQGSVCLYDLDQAIVQHEEALFDWDQEEEVRNATFLEI